jgi:hypothetical protein
MKYLSAKVTLIAMCLVLSACASSGLKEVGCAEFLESQHIVGDIDVAVGDEFKMSLCSNPTTGFQWSEQADTVSVEYSRPREGGEKAAWTFVMSVVVE